MNGDLLFREAVLSDIPEMHRVRMSVKENVLSHPSVVKESDYFDYISVKGKAWVCQTGGKLVGFSIVDLEDTNVWALFVHPDFEGRGIGKQLHDRLLDWYFLQTDKPLQLSTGQGTRAEQFYRLKGWKEIGKKQNGEVVFQMLCKP
jgi:GNAT superfamily N-acetyltransferase